MEAHEDVDMEVDIDQELVIIPVRDKFASHFCEAWSNVQSW